MYRFWDTIIEPILEALQPETLVEIGSDKGLNTRKLLAFCQERDAKLHVIDPLPKYDVAAWQEQYGEHLVFHKALSLDALPTIDGFDVVLIDGDHNWYTVFNELKLIEERCKDSSQHFPLVMLDDIGWPYGRRDLYYDPDTIPEQSRKSYKKSGLRPGSVELVEDGGINRNLANAVTENDARNGVLTAVEDFLEETDQEIELIQVPGFHGFGIIVPSPLKERNAEFAEFLGVLDLSPTIARYIELIEEARLGEDVGRQETDARAKRFQTRLEKESTQRARLEKEKTRLEKEKTRLEKEKTRLEKKNSRLEQQYKAAQTRSKKLEQRVQQLTDQNKDLEQRVQQLTNRNQSLTQQLQAIQDSRSWQLLNSLSRIRAKAPEENKAQ